MIDTACEPRARSYRVAEKRPTWPVHGANGLPAVWVRAGRPVPAYLGRLFHPALRRAAIPAVALLAYGTLTRAYPSAGMVRLYLIALILALAVGVVQTLLVPHGAGRAGTPATAERTSSEARQAQLAPVLSLTKLPSEPATGKVFDDAVRRAITHLCDPTRLAISPLLQLACVTAGLQDQGLEDTPFKRVAILKVVLTDLVNGLRPQDRAEGCTSAASRFYNCLHYPYVLGIARRRAPAVLRDLRERREQTGGPQGEQEQVLAWLLQVDEDTYYKWQRRASDTIAHVLREREHRLGGNIPAVASRAAAAWSVASCMLEPHPSTARPRSTRLWIS